jgi:hypothetical protein
MRWWIAVFAALLALLVLAGQAHAGIDNPLQHAPLSKHAESAVTPGQHCSKIGNPVECSSHSANTPNTHWGDPVHDKSCHWLRVMYEYHHATTGKPTSLTGLYGCRLWRADAAYHDTIRRLGINEFEGEALESMRDLVLSLRAAIQSPNEGATTP